MVEHERPVGAWHAEWHALTTALAATGGAVAAVARSLDGLKVDAARMRANISPETLSEAERFGLASGDAGRVPRLGGRVHRSRAREVPRMTLVYCGSLGSTAAMWEPQLAAFPADHVFELPGHGAAPVVDDVTVDSLATEILQTGRGTFSYVGLSLGGSIGMRVAAAAPDRVERLVLACTSVEFGPATQWEERAATVRTEGLEAIVDAVMARWFTQGFGDVNRWREMFLSIDREGYARCCEALAGRDAAGDLERITASTLVIAGAEDPTSPPAEAAKIAARVPGARVALIDGAAHLANVEQPEAFNRLLEEHLA